MTSHVHWVPDLAGVDAGSLVEVTGDEGHHAVAVRRLRAGEPVRLTDGAGCCVVGTVVEVAKRRFTVRVDERHVVARPRPRITVVQALPKGDRGELAVEMLTEVGVDSVVPWAASRCVAVWRGERATKSRNKWVATSREAAKQARRDWFPEVTELATTSDVVGVLQAADRAFVLHEEAADPLGGVLGAPEHPGLNGSESIALVVGPEGGVSPEEVAEFIRAGARAVRLGHEVLRTSTAGVAATAAVLAHTSRWR